MEKKTKNYIINSIIALLLCFIFWFIPPSHGLTQAGMRTIGIFLGMIYGMITIGYIVPGLIAIFLIGISGAYDSYTSALIASVGNRTVTLVLGLLLFGGVMSYSGLAKGLAERLINTNFASGKPWRLTFTIMLAAVIPSIFLHPIITIVIVLNICINIFDTLDIEKTSKWPMSIMLMVVTCAIVAQSVMPFQMAVATDYGILSGISQGEYALSDCLGAHMAACFGMLLIVCALMLLFVRIICKEKDIKKVYSYQAPDHKKPFDNNQKTALWILLGFIICLLLPIVLPKGSSLYATLNDIGTAGFSFLFVAIALTIHKKDGSKFITMNQITDAGMNWDLLVMMFAINGVCNVMTSETTGITIWLNEILTPMVANMSGWGVFAVLVIFAIIATNITDCIAVAFVLIPVVYTLTTNLGLGTLGFLCWVTRAAGMGIWLPAASPHIAILYSKTEDNGYINRKNILLYTVPIIVMYTILILTFGWWTTSWFPV